jgi:hypothetical protein
MAGACVGDHMVRQESERDSGVRLALFKQLLLGSNWGPIRTTFISFNGTHSTSDLTAFNQAPPLQGPITCHMAIPRTNM